MLPFDPPFTLGHENAGWVHELGPGVTGLEVGQPVAVYGPWGCGSCPRCVLGVETYCENPAAAPVPSGGGGLGPGGLSRSGGPPRLDQAVPRRYSLNFAAMARNVLNNVSLAQPVGVLDSPRAAA